MGRLVGLLPFFLLLVTGAFAARQETTTIVGTVRYSPATIPGVPRVPVWLAGTPYETRTDSVGRFQFRGVPAGIYNIRTRSMGFCAVDSALVVPDTGALVVDLTLRAAIHIRCR